MESAAKSRARKVCGFFVGAPVLVALMGGREPCRFLLRRFPGLPHPSALPPNVEVGRQFLNGTCEANMANLSVGASAQITPFSFESHAVRVIMRDGEPWFVAVDVCAALAVQNVTQAVARLDDDERSMFNIGRQGDASIINESGLYSLILGSRKPEAKRFKKWVTSEVLPAIRKTGRYETKSEVAPSLLRKRWLVSFNDDGVERAKPLPMEAMVLVLADLPALIRQHEDPTLPSALVAEVARACADRLHAELAEHKKVGRQLAQMLNTVAQKAVVA